MRSMAILLTILTLAGCANGSRPTGSSGPAPTTDVNPVTGSRGGSGSK